jgi:hypothetical protein
MVRAEVPKGKKAWSGAFAIRASGSFRVGNGDGINHKYCKLLHRGGRLWLCPAARVSSPG